MLWRFGGGAAGSACSRCFTRAPGRHCTALRASGPLLRRPTGSGTWLLWLGSFPRADGQLASMRVGETTRARHAWMGGWAGADEEAAIHWGDPLVAAGQYQKNQGIVVPSRSALNRLPGGHRARRTARSAARQQRSIVPVPAARAANAPLRICRCTRPPTHTCTRTHARMEGIGCARVVCAALN